MHSTRRRFLAVAATATTGALAGCTSGDEGSSGTTTSGGTTDSGMTTTDETATGTTTGTGTGSAVQVAEHAELGEILVGPKRMTLYMFDSDTRGDGASTCYDSCAENWPPLTASSPTKGDGVTTELATFERDGGETQVTANGWPLYYFAPDENPGDAKGQGVSDVWWVLAPDGTPVKSSGTTTGTNGTEATTTTGDGGSGGDSGDGSGGGY